MEFFSHKTNIDFLGVRKWAALFSAILIIASVVSLCVNGLNWGLDFTGGTEFQMHYQKPADLPLIRAQLEKAGFNDFVVQSYGTSQDILINIAPHQKQDQLSNQSSQDAQAALKQVVLQALPDASVKQVEYVGPKVGHELATAGALAVIVAMIGTMIYILMRFEYRFAVSSTLALIHDPVVILGVFSYFHLQFDLNVLAALLAVIGYSLNDTIVVFDRIRENFRKMRKGTPIEIVNKSINETLSRTLMTSSITLTVTLVLFYFAGEQLKGFSLALIIGIVIGTYSSIYVAGTIAVAMGLNKKDLMPTPKDSLDMAP